MFSTRASSTRTWLSQCNRHAVLARHAIELFLKGAIITRSQNAKFDHDLERLTSKYDKLYPEKQFSWSLPFTTEYPDMMPAQITAAKKNIPPEQIYRYPIDKTGATKWAGIFALEPRKFRHEMRVAETEMTALIRKISTADKTRKTHRNLS